MADWLNCEFRNLMPGLDFTPMNPTAPLISDQTRLYSLQTPTSMAPLHVERWAGREALS